MEESKIMLCGYKIEHRFATEDDGNENRMSLNERGYKKNSTSFNKEKTVNIQGKRKPSLTIITGPANVVKRFSMSNNKNYATLEMMHSTERMKSGVAETETVHDFLNIEK